MVGFFVVDTLGKRKNVSDGGKTFFKDESKLILLE